ncbi:MAG: DUF4148 domain-containing protein [Ramlibacter sp.]|nr:DUF4148 domain-containing protein [Ramlibacter sp.]
MSIRQTALALIIAAAAVPAFAQTGGTWINGEIGFAPDPPKSQLTREQVKQELASFLRQGGRVSAGEMLAFIPAGSAVTAASTASTATLGNAPASGPATITEPFVNGGPN